MVDTRFKPSRAADTSLILTNSLTILLGILGQGLRDAEQAPTLQSARAKIVEADILTDEIARLALAIADAIGRERQ